MSFVPTATAVLNYWVRILAALEKKINRQSYETWLKPTRFSHIAGRTLYVRIPSAEFQDVCEKYTDLIQEAVDNLGLEIETVTFTTPQQDPSAPRVREDGGLGLFVRSLVGLDRAAAVRACNGWAGVAERVRTVYDEVMTDARSSVELLRHYNL